MELLTGLSTGTVFNSLNDILYYFLPLRKRGQSFSGALNIPSTSEVQRPRPVLYLYVEVLSPNTANPKFYENEVDIHLNPINLAETRSYAG